MIVLEYKTEDFTIEVSTTDITFPWRKFCARVAAPESYSRYEASPVGDLRLFDYNTGGLSADSIPPEDWPAMCPVFFESNDYGIAIHFKRLAGRSEPKILHPDKRVSEMFNFFRTKDGGELTGNLHFLNEPGRFDLRFQYERETGDVSIASFSFDVVSPKLDTKKDLETIIRDIKAEYDDLVFRYLSLTVREYSLGRETNNDLVWLSIFKQIIEKYLVAVRYVIHAPHNNNISAVEYQKPDRIRQWTNPLAEKFLNDWENDKEKAARRYYRTEQTDTTLDTLENRFVKYTVGRISERLRSLVFKISSENVSESEISSLDAYSKELEILRRNSFFSSIGRFEGFRQESLVLQQRSGYAQVYRYWIMLQNGISLIEGENAIGVQPIWRLYELWCFLEVKRIVAQVLGIDPQKPECRKYIKEDMDKAFDPFSGGNLTGSTTYTNPVNGDNIEIGYQYTFENREAVDDGMQSMTVEQKPDIVMHIHKADGFTLTYLFDAKYRVEGLDDNDSAIDRPVEDTINQMHRYRDSIYYKIPGKNGWSKEIIGGYILFPGRLDESKYLRMIESFDYNNKELPYYLKSIGYVNIGAFPLLPNENSGLLLRNFIKRVLLEDSVKQQLNDSIPQRGLYYSFEDEGDNVIFGCYKSPEHLAWIKRTKKYNLRLDRDRKGAVSLSNDFTHAKYLVLYAKGDSTSDRIFALTGESEVVTAEDLLSSGYPQPGGKIYLTLGITEDVHPRLKGNIFHLDKPVFDTDACIPQIVKYTNLIPPELPAGYSSEDIPDE